MTQGYFLNPLSAFKISHACLLAFKGIESWSEGIPWSPFWPFFVYVLCMSLCGNFECLFIAFITISAAVLVQKLHMANACTYLFSLPFLLWPFDQLRKRNELHYLFIYLRVYAFLYSGIQCNTRIFKSQAHLYAGIPPSLRLSGKLFMRAFLLLKILAQHKHSENKIILF